MSRAKVDRNKEIYKTWISSDPSIHLSYTQISHKYNLAVSTVAEIINREANKKAVEVDTCVYCEKMQPIKRWKETGEMVCYDCRLSLLEDEWRDAMNLSLKSSTRNNS